MGTVKRLVITNDRKLTSQTSKLRKILTTGVIGGDVESATSLTGADSPGSLFCGGGMKSSPGDIAATRIGEFSVQVPETVPAANSASY